MLIIELERLFVSSDNRVASRWGQKQTERVHRRRVAAIISQGMQKKKKCAGRRKDRRDPVTSRAGRALDS